MIKKHILARVQVLRQEQQADVGSGEHRALARRLFLSQGVFELDKMFRDV